MFVSKLSSVKSSFNPSLNATNKLTTSLFVNVNNVKSLLVPTPPKLMIIDFCFASSGITKPESLINCATVDLKIVELKIALNSLLVLLISVLGPS